MNIKKKNQIKNLNKKKNYEFEIYNNFSLFIICSNYL